MFLLAPLFWDGICGYWMVYIYMDTIEANMVSIICTKPKVRGAHLS